MTFTRITAVDKVEISDALLRQANRLNGYKCDMTKGQYACAASHLKTMSLFLESDADYALVFEDDAEPHHDIVRLSQAATGRNNAASGLARWEVLKLDGQRRYRISCGEITPDFELIDFLFSIPTAATGLIYTRHFAKQFLRTASPITRPVDVQLQHPWEHGCRVLTVSPPWVVGTIGGSTIDYRRIPVWPHRNLMFQANQVLGYMKLYYGLYGLHLILKLLWRKRLRLATY